MKDPKCPYCGNALNTFGDGTGIFCSQTDKCDAEWDSQGRAVLPPKSERSKP